MKGFRRTKRFGERINLPKPIKVGEEYDVEINEVGSRGDGIARIKNFVVFVGNTKKGEKAHIKIKEVRNRFAIGEKTESSKDEAITEEEKSIEEEPEVPIEEVEMEFEE